MTLWQQFFLKLTRVPPPPHDPDLSEAREASQAIVDQAQRIDLSEAVSPIQLRRSIEDMILRDARHAVVLKGVR